MLQAERGFVRHALEVVAIPCMLGTRCGDTPDALRFTHWQGEFEGLIQQFIGPGVSAACMNQPQRHQCRYPMYRHQVDSFHQLSGTFAASVQSPRSSARRAP